VWSAVGAVPVPSWQPAGTRRQGRRRRNRRPTVEAYEGSPMQSLVQIAIGGGGRHARAAVRADGALDGVCVLGAGAAVVAQGVGGVETRPLARPPKATQKKSLDAAVA
jgi:hypothetical protein